jgi:hypothetical protein
MSKWIREDGYVFTSSSNSQVDLSDLYELHRFFEQLEKETEEWEKDKEYESGKSSTLVIISDRCEDLIKEMEKYAKDDKGMIPKTESGTDPNGKGNGSGSDPISRPKNNSERVKLGRPCEWSECTCGHKGCTIPLSSHSDWCDYRLWKESLVKKADEYSSGRIFF